MDAGKKWTSGLLKVGFIILLLAAVSVIAGSFIFFEKLTAVSQTALILQLSSAIISLLTLIVLLVGVWLLFNARTDIAKNTNFRKDVAVGLDKNHSILTKVDHNTHLSERAKSIVFREADTNALREIVFNRLQQKDFDGAYEVIGEIGQVAGYKKLAETLNNQARKYQNATDQERENQVIAHIEKLIDSNEWSKAHSQIEKLRWSYPESQKVETVTQKLKNKRLERKKILLVAWDSAVKRQDTDRCIEILRELDQYLTPTEGLALQESARDVFRTKLHSLGVRFSLAVSERHWPLALEVGKQIITDFPNSKMSEEIRTKLNILTQKVNQQV